MKINPLTGAVRFLNEIKENRDQERRQHQDQQPGQNEKEEERDTFEVNLEKIDQALEAFQTDAQTQSNGLNASREGQGPGLKVVLKDGTGSVVRQFTGEEFLKLRSATTKDGRARGKILDQKL